MLNLQKVQAWCVKIVLDFLQESNLQNFQTRKITFEFVNFFYHIRLGSLVFKTLGNNYKAMSAGFECWRVPGLIPSQGPRHTKDVIKMVPVVPLFSTEHSKGKYWLFIKNQDRKRNVMDKIWDRKSSKAEVIGRCVRDEKNV